MPRLTWPQYAMTLARAAALRSEDPFVQVGAVVLRADRSVAATGYNGAPSGIELDWSDRDARRQFVIHAETNALRYVSAGEARGGLIAVTGTPCSRCLLEVASHGIRLVLYGSTLEHYDLSESLSVADRLGLTLQPV